MDFFPLPPHGGGGVRARWFFDRFPKEQLDLWTELLAGQPLKPAEVYGSNNGKTIIPEIRAAQVAFVPMSGKLEPLAGAVAGMIAEANDFLRVDLMGLYEGFQYTEYPAPDHGHFDWHADDNLRMPFRKITLTMQLSEPDEYEGGDLEIDGVELPPERRKRGFAVVFHSYRRHRVTPVTKGLRRAVVVWAHGPAWR